MQTPDRQFLTIPNFSPKIRNKNNYKLSGIHKKLFKVVDLFVILGVKWADF